MAEIKKKLFSYLEDVEEYNIGAALKVVCVKDFGKCQYNCDALTILN